MRVVAQRSGKAECEVDDSITGAIPFGLVVLVSIDPDDTDKDIIWMANKLSGLRIFPDDEGKMNRSILDLVEDWKSLPGSTNENRPGILSISQFTLHGKVKKGFRPSFDGAAKPEKAEKFYNLLNDALRNYELYVAEGIFGAMMKIRLVNEGPVTILIDSKGEF